MFKGSRYTINDVEENWLKAVKWGYVVSAFKEIDKGIYQRLKISVIVYSRNIAI